MSDEPKATPKVEAVVEEKEPTVEAKVEITKEMAEKIEEAVAKGKEAVVEKQKKFAFHGTEQAKKELTKAEKAVDASIFVKAVAQGNHAVATEYSDKRAKSLGLDKKELMQYGISTKTITIAGSAGSQFLVPTVFETEILGTFDSYDEIISDADVRSFSGPGHVFSLNEIDTRVTAFYVDENSTGLTASQPTYSEPQIAISDLIGSTTITLDFMEDTEVDIMSDLSRQYGEEMAKKIQARLINGDVTVSSVITKGILNTSGLNAVLIGNTTGGFSSVSADDIENMFFDAISIDHFQRANQDGKFYMNGVTLYNLRKNIRAAATSNDVLSVFDPVAMTLMGKPIVITNQMPTPTTTVSDPFIVYGNLAQHLKIRRKRGLTMKVNDTGTAADGRNLNYQLGRELVVSQRIGHQVVLAEGLTVLQT